MSLTSPATGRRRAAVLPPEERRSAIVAAALPLLLEHGEQVTTKQIADASGIAEGTVFRVFPDKDAVIQAVVEAALDPAPLEEAIAGVDADQDLEAALHDVVRLIQARSMEVWRVTAAVGPRFHERKPHVAVSEALVTLLKAHRDRLSISPTDAARTLRGLTLTLTHPMLIEAPVPPKRIVHLFLHGAGA
jgi:AcrR family transcriptional regulator